MEMTKAKKKFAPGERVSAVNELRKKQQPILDSLGVEDANYIPKMAHYKKGLPGLHMGFYESELKKGDIYTEMISINMESEDPDRKLYYVKGNPHYEEEYASDKDSSGNIKYFVPLCEMQVMTKAPAKALKPVTSSQTSLGLLEDESIDNLTLRDYAALKLRKPLSNKEWLNKMIEG